MRASRLECAHARSVAEEHEVELAAIALLGWAPDPAGSTGTLSVLGTGLPHSYAGLTRADGRDLIAGIRTVRPAVRFMEPTA